MPQNLKKDYDYTKVELDMKWAINSRTMNKQRKNVGIEKKKQKQRENKRVDSP